MVTDFDFSLYFNQQENFSNEFFNCGKFKGTNYDDILDDLENKNYIRWLMDVESSENRAFLHDQKQIFERIKNRIDLITKQK